jgi:hypothetical protein
MAFIYSIASFLECLPIPAKLQPKRTFLFFVAVDRRMSITPQRMFEQAIDTGNIQQLRRLLEHPEVDPVANHQNDFIYACLHGKTEIVRIFLADPRVDPSANEQDALRSACSRGHTEIVRLLLADPRVDPSVSEQASIESACFNGYTEIARLLLADPRVDPSIKRNQILQIASRRGYTEIVRLLLADPRVNPRITPQKAHILRTNITIDFAGIIQQYKTDSAQLLISLDHALEKELLKKTAKNLVGVQSLEAHNTIIPNIANTVATFSGNRNRKNTITRSLYKAKGNYFGPAKAHRKRTRKNTLSK